MEHGQPAPLPCFACVRSAVPVSVFLEAPAELNTHRTAPPCGPVPTPPARQTTRGAGAARFPVSGLSRCLTRANVESVLGDLHRMSRDCPHDSTHYLAERGRSNSFIEWINVNSKSKLQSKPRGASRESYLQIHLNHSVACHGFSRYVTSPSKSIFCFIVVFFRPRL